MKSLQGVLSAAELEIINTSVELRFQDKRTLKTPEALIIYEQRILDEASLLELCSIEYGMQLETPTVHYLSQEIINHFVGMNCVPISLDSVTHEIRLAVLPELYKEFEIKPFKNFKNVPVFVPLHYYVQHFTNTYHSPKFLYELPVKDLFDFIVAEAVEVQASDITVANTAGNACVYYNVKKKKVYAKRVISQQEVRELANFICTRAGSPMVEGNRRPKYVGVRLDTHHRGRAVINSTFHGQSITTRVLPDSMLTTTLEELNHNDKTIRFLRDIFMSREKGLRLAIGPTMSGKNTTILSSMLDMLKADTYKAVSVEYPVEIIVPNMEQIDVESEEEYEANVDSLLRQNPDLVYISEMTEITALGVMKVANTGKVIFSSIHANSIAEVIFRIQDLTGLPFDRIILSLHSAFFQELENIDGELVPFTKCLYFSEELKMKLLGKNLGEIYAILREEELKWC